MKKLPTAPAPGQSIGWLISLGYLLFATSIAHAEINDPHYSAVGSWKQDFADQWALKQIGFTSPEEKNSAWSIETGKSNPVIVAVLDTGIDFHHPDLARQTIWRNDKEQANGIDDDGNGYIDDLIGWNFVEKNNNPWDFAGHGTHIAGVIGANTNNNEGIAGINWGVKIMPLKIMNFVGRGRTVRLAEAIFYAVKHGARIINLSLGVEQQSPIMQSAINYALENNVLVVAAAGNEGKDTAQFSPAGLENVITVAATDHNNKRALYSNWGDAVDIAAPGTDILSLRARHTDFALLAQVEDYQAGDGFVGDQNKLYRMSGTSFSAPFVTAVASLIMAKNPNYTAAEVKRILLNSAADIEMPGIDRSSGYGLLDAHAALSANPDYFINARISGISVIQAKGKAKVRVLGTAEADRMKNAWIEIGVGESPASWRKVGGDIKGTVKNGTLADIDAGLFRSAKSWTLKLVCKHKDGSQREFHFQFNLG